MNRDPVALVTGGSRVIGRAVVVALLREGMKVHFCARDPRPAAEMLIERWGNAVHGHRVDVRDQQDVDALVARVLDQEGRVDCLVNNAGVGYFAPVDELSGEDWRRVVETNLHGAFYFTRAVAPAMRERGEGLIVNIASLAARHPLAGGTAYNASKFGLRGFSEAAMLDLRGSGIKVTAILPGSVATDFHADGGDEGWMLTAEDVARAVVDVLQYPARALPSAIELRPARPGR